MDQNSLSSTDEKDLIEILELIEESFQGKDNQKKKEIIFKLESKFKNLKRKISLLIKALSLKIINNKQISLDLYLGIIIYLKNIFSSKDKSLEDLNSEELISYIQIFLEIILNTNKINPNLNDSKIFNIIQIIISNIFSFSKLISQPNYINQAFQIILDNFSFITKENFLNISKNVILLCTSLLSSKSAQNQNYDELINKYYIPIINIVFKNVPNFIDPKNNIYNNDFFCILKLLYEGFYYNLIRMKEISDIKTRKNIAFRFFLEYGMYSYELLQIVPSFGEETAKKYGNSNPIIIFSTDEKKGYEINHMKSNIFQFLSLITQISTLEEEKSDKKNKNLITDNELVKLINNVIVLIISSFENILNNKNKFIFIRRYNLETNEEDDCFNILLFQMCVFLSRSLIREPIKSEFSLHIKQFLLNVLFPMVITIDDELNFLNEDPDGYHQYIINIISEFKLRNFRIAACFLILKIADKFDDMANFILSFNIEMLNYIINEGNIKNEISEYNVYLKYIKDALINNFSNPIKMDFSFLIILIFKNYIYKIEFFLNRFRDIFINNQEKIHLISSPLIKIKICKIYKLFFPIFIKTDNKNTEQKESIFIQNSVNFLLNNVIQKNYEKGNNYIQSLGQEASETIIELFNISTYTANELFLKYISQNLENNFSLLIKLIEIINVDSFYLILEHILSEIKINQRYLVFECLDSLSKKFKRELINNSQESKIFCSHFFIILRNFLLGKNKLNLLDKQELLKFNKILEIILNCKNNPNELDFYEEIVSLTEDYIKVLNGINSLSYRVLKSIGTIIDLEKTTSLFCYDFTATFLSNINKNIYDQPINEADIFKEILVIIQKSFSIENESIENSKLFALLLTLQIMSLNPNINEEVLIFLLNSSFDCHKPVYENIFFPKYITNKNQLLLAILSLGFIFKPEITLKILNKPYYTSENGGVSRFDKFLQYIYSSLEITYPDYYPILGKCIILGICAILNNSFCQNFLDNNKEKKLSLIKIFISLLKNHIKEKTIIMNNLMKKEMKCHFVKEEEEEEEEEDEEEFEEESFDNEFNDKILFALKGNKNIINSDEFKYFSDIMKKIKEKDDELIKSIFGKGDNKNAFDKFLNIRNVKIKYNGKEFDIPRRIVRIIRK